MNDGRASSGLPPSRSADSATSVAGEDQPFQRSQGLSPEAFHRALDQALRDGAITLDNIASSIQHQVADADAIDLAGVRLTSFAAAPQCDHESLAKIREFRRKVRSDIVDALEAARASGTLGRQIVLRVLPVATRSPSWYGESLQANLGYRKRLIAIVREFRAPEYMLTEVVHDGLNRTHMQRPEFQEFLAEMPRVRRQTLTACAHAPDAHGNRQELTSTRRVQPRARGGDDRPASTDDDTGPPYVELREVELVINDEEDGRRHTLKGLGIQPAGPETDVVWGFSNWHGYGTRVVCLMKRPGELQPIFEADNQQSFGKACFDGRHVWLTISGRLLAIDPQDGDVVSMTQEHSLPEWPRSPPVGIAAGPGRTYWAGRFGEHDGEAVYLIEVDATDFPSIKVEYLHQALYEENPNDRLRGRTANQRLDFTPGVICPLRDENGQIRQLVFGRWRPGNLLFDLRTRQGVTLRSRTRDLMGHSPMSYQGSIYWAGNELWRLGPDDLDHHASIASVPEDGPVCFDETGRIYVFGARIWAAADVFARFELAESNVPDFSRPHLHQILQSSHYGLLLKASEGGKWRLYQIDLAPES